MDSEGAADPGEIPRKFAGSGIRLAADAFRTEEPFGDKRCNHRDSILSHASPSTDDVGETRRIWRRRIEAGRV